MGNAKINPRVISKINFNIITTLDSARSLITDNNSYDIEIGAKCPSAIFSHSPLDQITFVTLTYIYTPNTFGRTVREP